MSLFDRPIDTARQTGGRFGIIDDWRWAIGAPVIDHIGNQIGGRLPLLFLVQRTPTIAVFPINRPLLGLLEELKIGIGLACQELTQPHQTGDQDQP